MCATFGEYPFFSTLLQSGEQGISSTPMASRHDSVVLQAIQQKGKRPTSKKTQRGVSFILEEEHLLLLVWLNISMDVI